MIKLLYLLNELNNIPMEQFKTLNDIALLPKYIIYKKEIFYLSIYITAFDKLCISYKHQRYDALRNRCKLISVIVGDDISDETYTYEVKVDSRNVVFDCYIKEVDTIEKAFNEVYKLIKEKQYKTK